MIDLLNSLKIDIPTLAQTNITFYGELGYVMFLIMGVCALTGAMVFLKLLKKILKMKKK